MSMNFDNKDSAEGLLLGVEVADPHLALPLGDDGVDKVGGALHLLRLGHGLLQVGEEPLLVGAGTRVQG